METNNFSLYLLLFLGSWYCSYTAFKCLIFKPRKKYNEKIFLALIPMGMMLYGLVPEFKEPVNKNFARSIALSGLASLVFGFCHCAYRNRHRGYYDAELHPVEKEIEKEREFRSFNKIFSHPKKSFSRIAHLFDKIDAAEMEKGHKKGLEKEVIDATDALLDEYLEKKKKKPK